MTFHLLQPCWRLQKLNATMRETAKLVSDIMKCIDKRKSALLDSFVVKKLKSWL